MICPSCGADTDKIPSRPRSTGWKSQSHHFNGHCAQIAKETGNDFSDVKAGVKARAIKRGFPAPRSVKVKGGRSYDVFKSEADCDTKECAMLIDECHQIGD